MRSKKSESERKREREFYSSHDLYVRTSIEEYMQELCQSRNTSHLLFRSFNSISINIFRWKFHENFLADFKRHLRKSKNRKIGIDRRNLSRKSEKTDLKHIFYSLKIWLTNRCTGEKDEEEKNVTYYIDIAWKRKRQHTRIFFRQIRSEIIRRGFFF